MAWGRAVRRSVVLAAVVVGAVLPSAGAGAAEHGRPAASEHDRIVDYWTPARRASAVAVGTDHLVPAKGKPPGAPGGGGGGDGSGGTSTVTGAAWTAGGSVAVTTGKVFFTDGSTRYVCSGSVVGSDHGSLVLTAGHCVHGGGGDEFHTNWIFYPGYDAGPDADLGAWTATDLFTTATWADTANGFDDDAGFAVVTDGTTASLEDHIGAARPGTTIPVADFDTTAFDVDHSSFGYPAAKKYKGQTLTYCQGPVTAGLDGNATMSIVCDMTGGSSGGPWFRDLGSGSAVIDSVTSYGYSSLNGYLFGPVFGPGEAAAYAGADGSGDCPTTPPSGYRCVDYD